MDAITLARRNTVACLGENARRYSAAGNAELADLFAAAIEARYALIEAGEIEVGTWDGRE
ncbi:hypothetical protein [Xanthomonas euvesicatoria]|uniref:hypothetical protein n=1 Tax=Xanthomonas euvesicatoria TaxID=456327 RepID=UPI001C47A3D6|nr:hypothetical protein [Xanthomonas euvesicatoria]MBV6871804.1 hypothetical protein [Xanthomonas campestris pv. veroniae]